MFYVFSQIISVILAAPYHDEGDYYDYGYKEPKQRIPEKVVVKQEKTRPVSSYEVTENVNDIPNPNPVVFPIVSNITTKKPLNIVPAANKINTGRDINNVNNVKPNVINDPINNPYYFDIDKEIPDVEELDFDDKDDFSHEVVDETDELPNLRAFLYGLQKGIVNGLNTLQKGIYNVNKNVNEPNVNTNPVLFTAKLREKGGCCKK